MSCLRCLEATSPHHLVSSPILARWVTNCCSKKAKIPSLADLIVVTKVQALVIGERISLNQQIPLTDKMVLGHLLIGFAPILLRNLTLLAQIIFLLLI